MRSALLTAEIQVEEGVCYLAISGQGAVTLRLTPNARRALGAALSRVGPDDENSPGEDVSLAGCDLTISA